MSPAALPSSGEIQTTSNLAEAGVKHTIRDTAPSIAANGHPAGLQELDASKITFTRNTKPKAVPEPESADVTSMSV